MIKISVLIAGKHATSVSLEQEFYDALLEICRKEKQSLNQLITYVDENRRTENLSSAVRIYILKYIAEKSISPECFGQ
ncbi:MAG: ribbon-helix-helix domain-containing protein [Alphaproteobacteria bacterium]|nr:ribbon-helix-helix domain-containing protein [Alphaproteobacteria bacterium]